MAVAKTSQALRLIHMSNIARLLARTLKHASDYSFSFLFQPPKRPNSDSKPQEEEISVRGNAGDEDKAEAICCACAEAYANCEFWICCDICETWFYSKCVRITPAKGERPIFLSNVIVIVSANCPAKKILPPYLIFDAVEFFKHI